MKSDKKDEVRTVVAVNASSYPDSNAILSLYPESDQVDDLLRKDREEYKQALEELGFLESQEVQGEGGETVSDFALNPVVRTARRFEGSVDLRHAAAELDSTPEELRASIEKNPIIGRELGILRLDDKTVKREVFLDSFPAVARALGLGTPFDGDLVEAGDDPKKREEQEEAPRAFRVVDRYLDLPDVPKTEEDEFEYVIDEELNPVGRYELALLGFEKMTNGRCEIELVDDKPDHLIVKLLPNLKSIIKAEHEVYELAEFVVEGRKLIFRWRFLNIKGRLRGKILPYQQACRDVVLSIRENDDDETQLIGLHTVKTLPFVDLNRVIGKGEKKPLMRWPKAVVAKTLYLEKVKVHIAKSVFLAKGAGNSAEHASKVRIDQIENSFNLGDFQAFFIEIIAHPDACFLDADTNPSIQKLRKAVLGAESRIREVNRSLRKASGGLAAARKQLSSAQRLRGGNTSANAIRNNAIFAANANIRRFGNRVSASQAKLSAAISNRRSFDASIQRFEPFVQHLVRGKVSCKIYRFVEDVRLDVATIEPPTDIEF